MASSPLGIKALMYLLHGEFKCTFSIFINCSLRRDYQIRPMHVIWLQRSLAATFNRGRGSGSNRVWGRKTTGHLRVIASGLVKPPSRDVAWAYEFLDVFVSWDFWNDAIYPTWWFTSRPTRWDSDFKLIYYFQSVVYFWDLHWNKGLKKSDVWRNPGYVKNMC